MLKGTRKPFTSNRNGNSGAKGINEIDAPKRYRDAPQGNSICQELYWLGTKEKHM